MSEEQLGLRVAKYGEKHLISSRVFSGDIRTLLLAALALISDVKLSRYFHLFGLNNMQLRQATILSQHQNLPKSY